MRVSLALIALLILAGAADARTVWGPSTARTLAKSDEARVYARDGVAYGCHRNRREAYRLGRGVRKVLVVRRYAAVQRRDSLDVFDLRWARHEHGVSRNAP